MTTETGWLIEKNICGRAHWWTGNGWSIDSLCAIRFARKVDAEKAIQNCMLGKDCFATDHMWVGPRESETKEVNTCSECGEVSERAFCSEDCQDKWHKRRERIERESEKSQ